MNFCIMPSIDRYLLLEKYPLNLELRKETFAGLKDFFSQGSFPPLPHGLPLWLDYQARFLCRHGPKPNKGTAMDAIQLLYRRFAPFGLNWAVAGVYTLRFAPEKSQGSIAVK